MYNEFIKSLLYYSSLRRHERTETIGESMSIKDLVRSLVNKLTFLQDCCGEKSDKCQHSIQVL